MFPISGNAIVISIVLTLMSAPLAQLYGAVTDLKASAETAAVSIEARHRL
ncbi:TPA: hypothetical protein L5C15_005754 [Pseudomonas aeruginosa]|nr:hypothetical protein [Pseudomonas aeruginosa]HBO7934617.1 hypothetical protein [Pseudomonas aeruginosa]HBO8188559.1 hypothetical protein [Pseudomonas aeruginosa]HBO8713808.1 hypothetical protein [Pseudomonas aeruginosa]